MSLKRQIANLIERTTGNLVLPEYDLHSLPERMHLRRFFQHFGVDCVFDVGANSGQYKSMLREHVGFAGPVISFEPIPDLAASLQAQAKSEPNWHVEALALDREAGPATFNIMEASQFSSLRRPASDQPAIFDQKNKVAREVSVMRSILAAELPKWQAKLGFQRPFLKMDTQGNDLAVVEGAGEALQRFVGLQSELAFRAIYDGGADFAETIATYQRLGFQLSAFVPNNAGHFPMLVEMDCIMFRKDAAKVG